MHRETAHTPRRSRSLVVLLLALAAIALSATLLTTSASALPTFNTPVSSIGPCDKCHTRDLIHAGATHALQTCTKCHVSGTATPPPPSACASCHGAAAILAKPTHTTTGCSTTAGCHGAPSPSPSPSATPVATTVSLKVAPTSIKLAKTVKTTGAVTPVANLTGAKVNLTVQRKSGTKWVAAKSATATVKATGAYSWTYKPTKKGTYRTQATIKATSTYKASKTTFKTFKVT